MQIHASRSVQHLGCRLVEYGRNVFAPSYRSRGFLARATATKSWIVRASTAQPLQSTEQGCVALTAPSWSGCLRVGVVSATHLN
jgi:hypothetical protein